MAIIEPWIEILIYILSMMLMAIILVNVDWSKFIRYNKPFYGMLLYILLSIITGYGLGSVILKFIELSLQ